MMLWYQVDLYDLVLDMLGFQVEEEEEEEDEKRKRDWGMNTYGEL